MEVHGRAEAGVHRHGRAELLDHRGAVHHVPGGQPRPVLFEEEWADTPTYDRTRLAPGDVVAGPAVVEEFGSTVPVHPGFTATVDRHGNLLLERAVSRDLLLERKSAR